LSIHSLSGWGNAFGGEYKGQGRGIVAEREKIAFLKGDFKSGGINSPAKEEFEKIAFLLGDF